MGPGPADSRPANATASTRELHTSSTTPVYNETAAAIEFYKTYDVMTGVRIAATLGGFFGLMVILIVYKSKSKTEKALADPEFTAAAVAEVEEEERQLAAAYEASVMEELKPRRARRSIDTPPAWGRGTRFSSISGFMDPPLRPLEKMPGLLDEDSLGEERSVYDDAYVQEQSQEPRRPSNITCSSSGSSYLERRDSAVMAGLPALPAHRSKNRRRQSSPLPEVYDFYYPIDIRVIQPTPGGTPCGSDRAIYDHVAGATPGKAKLAPLASISSCNSSLGGPDPEETHSFTSDSVFQDTKDDGDTDDEIDPFSTDSDVNSDDQACAVRKKCRLPFSDSVKTPTVSELPMTVSKLPFESEPGCYIPDSKSSVTLVESPRDELSLTDSLKKVSSSSNTEERVSWAQETLF